MIESGKHSEFEGNFDLRQKRYSDQMTEIKDNGYISNFLIHWTGASDGKVDDEKGAEILASILATCQLLLSYNPIHKVNMYSEIHEKMVCFTDVPLVHSERHCSRYGRFGIAFHKLHLMNVGAQPVFYSTHVYKKDLDIIFRFLQDQLANKTLDENVFRALHKHFYYIQQLSEGRGDDTDSYYYEREWRLGSMTLPTPEELSRPNARYKCLQEGYGRYIGMRVIHNDGKEYFSFKKEDVAFLIIPTEWFNKIENPQRFPICTFEDLSKTRTY